MEDFNNLFVAYPLKVLIYLLIIGAVIGLGMFAFNQTMKYYYNMELLMNPCDLCTELNPQFKQCFIEIRENPTINKLEEYNLSGINLTEIVVHR